MHLIANTLLITLLGVLTNGENYGAKCVVCNTPKECENPEKVSCTEDVVQSTIANISKVFINAKLLMEPTKRIVCFAIHAHNLNNEEINIRGCMYYQSKPTNEPTLSYAFDFLPMYGKQKCVRPHGTIIRYIERFNRTYWNITHFVDYSCFQCDDYYCNIKIPPSKSGRILFQRPFRGSKQWECIKYQEISKQAFNQKCKDDDLIFKYKGNIKMERKDRKSNIECGLEWDWPNTIYVPRGHYWWWRPVT